MYEIGEIPKTVRNYQLKKAVERLRHKMHNKCFLWRNSKFEIVVSGDIAGEITCVIKDGDKSKTIVLSEASIGPRKTYATRSVAKISKTLGCASILKTQSDKVHALFNDCVLFSFVPEEKRAKVLVCSGTGFSELDELTYDGELFLSPRFTWTVKADVGRLKLIKRSKKTIDSGFFDLRKAADVAALSLVFSLSFHGRKK